LVINNIDAKPTVLRNVVASPGQWVDLRLVGDVSKKSPRDAIGSIAYVTTGKLRQRVDAISGAVYCSQNDPTLHFGLGAATKIDKLEIQWSNGTMETFNIPALNKSYTIVQGKSGEK
ncbi:MAG TPA: ASPIC/UnbV domain-containing protein, partial [Pyrinomonadaceae bacterium]|nr:ASPIC/UnbV domain-containing protein [Pyrinomonadaceae bacterium]